MKSAHINIILFVFIILIAFKRYTVPSILKEGYSSDMHQRMNQFADIVGKRLDYNDNRFKEIVDRQKEIMDRIDQLDQTVGELNADF